MGATKMCRATTILRLQSVLLLTALLATFTAQDVLAHGDHTEGCLGPHKNDPGCDSGGDDLDARVADLEARLGQLEGENQAEASISASGCVNEKGSI